MGHPYRESALAIPPAPYKHSFWMRIKRWHVRARLRLAGTFCARNPWPCPKCGKRTCAVLSLRPKYNDPKAQWVAECLRLPSLQAVAAHACCGSVIDASKGSGYRVPYSRQLQRRLNEESLAREREQDEMDAFICQQKAYEGQHAVGGHPGRPLDGDVGSHWAPYYEENKWE